MQRAASSWIFRYMAEPVQRGQKVQVTMERDHYYFDHEISRTVMERIPAGTVLLSPQDWEKLVSLLINTPMPDNFTYEVHEP